MNEIIRKPDDYQHIPYYICKNSGSYKNASGKCFLCALEILDFFIIKVGEESYHLNCVKCLVCKEDATKKGNASKIVFRHIVCQSCKFKLTQDYCIDSFIRSLVPCILCDQQVNNKMYLLIYPDNESPEENHKFSAMRVIHRLCAICQSCGRQISNHLTKCVVEKVEKRFYCESCSEKEVLQANSRTSSSPDDVDAENIETRENNAENNFMENMTESTNLTLGSSNKRPRTIITQNQSTLLVQRFYENPKPTKSTREIMAKELGLTARTVQVWFQNRRAKKKKLEKEYVEMNYYSQSEHALMLNGTSGSHLFTSDFVCSQGYNWNELYGGGEDIYKMYNFM